MTILEWLGWLKQRGAHEVGGEQYSRALYTLADSVQAATVLEIGAGWGHSSAAFAASISKRPPGLLISVDKEPERLLRSHRDFVANSGASWHLLDEDSATATVEEKVDLLYIDGDPARAESDFTRFYPNVRPGGLVVMDGYYGQAGPTDAVNALSRTHMFGIIPYNKIYAHAVHQKLMDDVGKVYGVECDHCGPLDKFARMYDASRFAEQHALNTRGHKIYTKKYEAKQ